MVNPVNDLKRVHVRIVVALVVAAASMFPAANAASAEYQQDYSSEGFVYRVIDGTATAYDCNPCSTDLVIPSTLGGYPVTQIGGLPGVASFDGHFSSVTVPDSVLTIGAGAFDYSEIETVALGNSLTTIGNGAFYGNRLTNLIIPDAVTVIGTGAFRRNNLTSLTIGRSVISIGDRSFEENALTVIDIPDSVLTIGRNAFTYNAISSLSIGDSVEDIGNFAFAYNSLTSVIVPNSVVNIGLAAFAGNEIALLTLSSGVTTIDDGAFSSNLLTSIVIPSSVRYLGGTAFSNNFFTEVRFLGNAPLSEGDTFAGNTGRIKLFRSWSASGWEKTWEGIKVLVATERATAIVKPTVAGTAVVGTILTVNPGNWTGYPQPKLTFSWYQCTRLASAASETLPGSCTRLSGATKRTFKLSRAQYGTYIAVYVTGASPGTIPTSWLSMSTSQVVN